MRPQLGIPLHFEKFYIDVLYPKAYLNKFISRFQGLLETPPSPSLNPFYNLNTEFYF